MFNPKGKTKSSGFLFIAVFLITALACNRTTQMIPAPITSTSTPATTILNTPSPAPRSFTPGVPTATPLGTDITDPNFIKGVSEYNAKNYEEVIILMSAVIQASPNLAPPYRYRGLSFWYLKDCKSALNDFEQALSINPEYAAAWGGRGISYSCLGNDAQAVDDFHKALALDPSLAFVHHNLGSYYYKLGDYERSLEEHSLSVAIDPNRSVTWTARSEALTKLGRYHECIDSATNAVEANPEEWPAYTSRAFCKAMLGDHIAAIDDYKVFLAHDATDAQTWYNLGYSQYHGGLIQESAISYSQTLELDPAYFQAYINRGLDYVMLERYDEALVDYNRALEFGDIPFAYSGRGDAYYGLKIYDLAIADYEKAISLMQGGPSSAHSYCMVALTYYEVGRYQDALDAATISYNLNPACGGQRLLEIQARSYYALGDYEQAILYMNKAFQMGEFVLGYYYRGIIYHDAGRYEEALSDLNFFIASVQDEITYTKEIADAKARLAELMP